MSTSDDSTAGPVSARLGAVYRAIAVPDLADRLAWSGFFLLVTAAVVALGLSAGPTTDTGSWLLGVLLLIFATIPLLLSVSVLRHGRPLVEIRL